MTQLKIILLLQIMKKIDQNNLDEAIKTSKLGNFISELPEGLETIVGRDGIKLSGGQSKEYLLLEQFIEIQKFYF